MNERWSAYFFINPRPWMLANEADLAIDSERGELWHTAAWEANGRIESHK